MATQTTPQDDAGLQGKTGLEAQGLAPEGRGPLEPRRARADRARRPPRRGPARRHGAVLRRSRAAHRPLAERQVRRQGAVVGSRRRLGQGQPAVHRAAVRHAARRRAARTSNGSDELFVQDLYCGADPKYRLSVRYVSPNAWHMAFVRNMFIRPDATRARRRSTPNFTVLHAPEFAGRSGASTARAPARSSCSNLAKRMILIGGTRYAGELKKSMFTVMNYYMPKQGVLSMHCSANIGAQRRHRAVLRPLRHRQDDALRRSRALAHRRRRARLVAEGIFNFEGGCYAKVDQPLAPRASRTSIATTQMFGTILENVVLDPATRKVQVRGSVDHREHARVVSAALHPEPRAERARRASEEHRLPHGRRVRRAAADRAAHARAGDVLLPLRLHGEGRGHGARREGAAGDVLVVLRRGVPRLASDASTPRCSAS